MADEKIYSPDAYRDLPFDVSPHAEGFKSFAMLQLSAESIRPALRARDLVTRRVTSCRFQIGVTDDVIEQEEREQTKGCIAFEKIGEADNAAGAEQIRADVERYFLRHYPGRTIKYASADNASPAAKVAYIVCYPKV